MNPDLTNTTTYQDVTLRCQQPVQTASVRPVHIISVINNPIGPRISVINNPIGNTIGPRFHLAALAPGVNFQSLCQQAPLNLSIASNASPVQSSRDQSISNHLLQRPVFLYVPFYNRSSDHESNNVPQGSISQPESDKCVPFISNTTVGTKVEPIGNVSQPESDNHVPFISNTEVDTEVQPIRSSSQPESDQRVPFISNMRVGTQVSEAHPVISVPTIRSSQESKLCIGSVFSLAGNTIKQDQVIPNVKNLVALGKSDSQQKTQECQALNFAKDKKFVKRIAQDSQIWSHIFLNTSAIHTQSPTSAISTDESTNLLRTLLTNTVAESPSCNTKQLNKTDDIYTLPKPKNTQKVATLKPCSEGVAVSMCVNSGAATLVIPGAGEMVSSTTKTTTLPTSSTAQMVSAMVKTTALATTAAGEMVSSTVKTTADTLSSSHNDDSKTNSNSKLKTKETNITHASPQDCGFTPQIVPQAVKDQETEVVDLDTEDIDDCLLVKIDLSRHCFPYGNKIHNMKVVIDDDSDNDVDVTDLTTENEDRDSLICTENSEVLSSPSSVVDDTDACELTDTLNMEVEEINSDIDPLIKNNFQQTEMPYNECIMEVEETNSNTEPFIKNNFQQTAMQHNECYPERTINTPSILYSVQRNKTDTQVKLKKEYFEESSSTSGNTDEHLKFTSCATGNAEFELMDLQVIDETPLSASIECPPLKVITPSKFLQPNNNLSIELVESVSTIPSASSNFTTAMSSLQTSDQNVYNEVAFPDQGSENLHKEVSKLDPHENVLPYQLSDATAIPKQVTKPKSPCESQLVGKTGNSTVKPAEQFPSAAMHKKLCDVNSFTSGTSFQSRKETCKMCYMSFSSRMDLVTHTWNIHRFGETNASYKCEFCDKNFPNKSLLNLHIKIRCPSLDKQTVAEPKKSVVGIAHNQCTGSSTVESYTNVTHSSTDGNVSESGGHEVTAKQTLIVLNHNPLNWNENTCDKEVNSVKFETDVENSLLPHVESLKTEIVQESQSECQMTEFRNNIEQLESLTHSMVSNYKDELMCVESEQEDIKPHTAFIADVEQQSQHLTQEGSGESPVDMSTHECCNCHKKFTNQLQLQEHRLVSEICNISMDLGFKCSVCLKTFSESASRYLHMWNNPVCKDGLGRYCFSCSNMFNSPTDKQAHLSLSKTCWLYEGLLMKEVVRTPIVKNVDNGAQNRVDVDSMPDAVHCELCNTGFPNYASLSQHFKMNSACKSHDDEFYNNSDKVTSQKFKTLRQNKVKTSAACPACKHMFPTKAMLKLHLNDSYKCKIKTIKPIKATKRKPLIGRKKTLESVQTAKCNKRVSVNEILRNLKTGSSLASSVLNDSSFSTSIINERIVEDDIHESEFCLQGELLKHSTEKKSITPGTKNLRRLRSLAIVLKPISVMCEACHSPFIDDLKLAEHLQFSQSCLKINAKKTLEMKKLLSGKEKCKKRRSCEIVSGITNATSTMLLIVPEERHTALREPPIEVVTKIEESVSEIDNEVHSLPNFDMQALNSSSTSEVCADDGGNGDGSENDSILDDLSSSDSASVVEESDSISEYENSAEYKCKLCSKAFTSRSLYVKHNKLHHSQSHRSVNCKVCTRKFHDLTDLQAHLLQFQFCFIPLTRTLWKRKQDQQICNMCQKKFDSPKDLRKHCFKKMACRLRYVNVVLKNIKGKGTSSGQSPSSSVKKLPISQTLEESFKSKLGTDEVSSSVQHFKSIAYSDHPISLQAEVCEDISNTEIRNALTAPSMKCVNCGKTYNDFLGHLFRQQACLDFFGIHRNKCPVPLPFCFQCKEGFDDIVLLADHVCKGFIAYMHACQSCGLKFTSEKEFNIHIFRNISCSRVTNDCTETQNHQDRNSSLPRDSRDTRYQGGKLPSSSKAVVTNATDMHSTEHSYSCNICDAKFPMIRLLMEHSYQHVEETAIKCERCNITFLHYNQFVSHQAFHIRMDKEASILPTQGQYAGPSGYGASNNYENTAKDQKVSNHVSVCLFCHQEFPNKIAKVDHISNTSSCMGIMKYIVENMFFIKNLEDNLSSERTTCSNNCEFCHLNFPDKIFHYLQSECLNKLEEAILRFRGSCGPAASQQEETADIQNNSIETTFANIPSLALQNFLTNDRREQHKYSSNENPIKATIESEEIYCLICNTCLRTLKDIEKHKSLCARGRFLPRNVVEHVDFEMPNLSCKICDINYTLRHALITHMIKEHCCETNVLLEAAGHKTSQCAVCSKNILFPKLKVHFQQHKDTFFETVETSQPKKNNPYNEICIFCKKIYFSKAFLHRHIERHTLSDIFITYCVRTKASSKQEKSLVDTHPKVHHKKQALETSFPNAEKLLSKIQCKICSKKLSCHNTLKAHVMASHKQYYAQSYKEPFSQVQDSEQTVKSMSDISLLEYDASGSTKFDSECQKKKFSISKKISKTPIGSCRICNKIFINLQLFKFHLKTAHNMLDSEAHQKLLQPVIEHMNDDSALSHSSHLVKPKSNKPVTGFHGKTALKNYAHCSVAIDDQNDSVLKISSFNAVNEGEMLSRVCLLCQASFRSISLYQFHLKAHVKTCRIILHDCCHLQTKSIHENRPCFIDMNREDAEVDFTFSGQEIASNQVEMFHPDSTTSEDIKCSQGKMQHLKGPVYWVNHSVFSTQDQMSTLKDSSELQSVVYGTETKPTIHALLMSKASDQSECMIRSVSSSADEYKKNGKDDVQIQYVEDTNDSEYIDVEDITNHLSSDETTVNYNNGTMESNIVKVHGFDSMHYKNAPFNGNENVFSSRINKLKFKQAVLDYIQKTACPTESLANHISQGKRKVEEIDEEGSTEFKRSKEMAVPLVVNNPLYKEEQIHEISDSD